MVNRIVCSTVAIVLLAAAPAVAQRQQSVQDLQRERARQPYEAGLQYMQREAFEAAIRSFEQATDLDPTFDMAYYMLGRTHLVTRSYAAAIVALTKCRDLHLAESTKQLLNRQEIQSQRRRRVDEMNELIGQVQQAIQAGGRDADRLRAQLSMLQERKRQVEDAERQFTSEQAVPAFVSLSLGSAYFRANRLAEAEEGYRATIAADPKVGEAHNNLAVVYMETGRFDEAERAIRNAEKVGFRVSPALKDEVKKRRSRT